MDVAVCVCMCVTPVLGEGEAEDRIIAGVGWKGLGEWGRAYYLSD